MHSAKVAHRYIVRILAKAQIITALVKALVGNGRAVVASVDPEHFFDQDQRFVFSFQARQQAAGLGRAIAADRTLGGLCDWVEAEAPVVTDLPIEGAETIKGATVAVVLHYCIADPLI